MSTHLQSAHLENGETRLLAPPRTRSFQLMLHESVVTGLTDVLGSAGARAALFHLGLTVSADARKVHEGLVRIFGMGAQALESTILRELFVRVGSRFEPEESLTFAQHVSEAKRMHSRQKGKAVPA